MSNRDTKYATELAKAILSFGGGSEARMERLFVKEKQTEEIRFSWWQDGRMIPRPLDLPEDSLVALIREAIAQEVLSKNFLGACTSATTHLKTAR